MIFCLTVAISALRTRWLSLARCCETLNINLSVQGVTCLLMLEFYNRKNTFNCFTTVQDSDVSCFHMYYYYYNNYYYLCVYSEICHSKWREIEWLLHQERDELAKLHERSSKASIVVDAINEMPKKLRHYQPMAILPNRDFCKLSYNEFIIKATIRCHISFCPLHDHHSLQVFNPSYFLISLPCSLIEYLSNRFR